MPTPQNSLEIRPYAARSTTVTVPGSKSISNRALVAAAVADGESRLRGLLKADDTDVMVRALRQLGVAVDTSGSDVLVRGVAGPLPAGNASVDVHYSGTTLRFLLPLLAAGRGEFVLTGQGRMLQRPIQDQLDALAELGVAASSISGNGCPPVSLQAAGLPGGRTTVAGDRSSQYLSGLLLAAPLAAGPTELTVTGELQSKPFVDVTLRVMKEFGVTVERDGYSRFTVQPSSYLGREYLVEGDATAAGNFWVAAAVTGTEVEVANVGSDSMQGDTALLTVLEQMGCRVVLSGSGSVVTGPPAGQLKGGDFDLNDFPDQALALAVAGLFTDSPLTIRNVSNMRIKETDRLEALATELRRLGAGVEEGPDWIRVSPQTAYRSARIETYSDHRMAMAFAVAGLVLPGITILDPACVDKTYPDYWRDFALLQAGSGVAA